MPQRIQVVDCWDTLGWYDRKRICWLTWWSIHKKSPRFFVSILFFLVVIVLTIEEIHLRHKIVLLSGAALFYFHVTVLDFWYQKIRRAASPPPP
jgi:hypothetical protein